MRQSLLSSKEYEMKNSKSYLLLATSLFYISACGGDGDTNSPQPSPAPQPTPPPVLTGSLGNTPIIGAKFETATQSGVTNEKGEFSFIAGETLRFSIGGIEIGKIAAANSISLSDFYDDPLPTNTAEIEKFSQDELAESFDSLINLASFLVSLDNNDNVDDGIDISAWETPLSDVSLGFDEPLKQFLQFTFADFVRAYAIESKRYAKAMKYIYESEEITVSESKVLSTNSETTNDDMVWSDAEIFTYDINGNQLTYTKTEDLNNDGADDYIAIDTRTYDEQGNRITRETIVDNENDGTIDLISKRRNTYDDRGNQTAYLIENDNDANGNTDVIVSAVITYNAMNLQTSTITEVDNDADGIAERITSISITFDDNTNRLSRRVETDNDKDGNADSITIETNTYNASGERLIRFNERDNNGNGIIDQTSTLSATYNAQGRLLTETFERDNDNNGAADFISTRTLSYNDEGRLLEETNESDFDNNGIIDSLVKITNTYNERNQLLTRLSEVDNGNGVGFTKLSYTYNGLGLRITITRERGDDGDVSNTDVTRYEYDADRNIIGEIRESFSDGETSPNSILALQFTFDEKGNQKTRTLTNDNNGDGQIEEKDTTTTSHTDFSVELTPTLINVLVL